MPSTGDEYVLLDAGVFIGALLTGIRGTLRCGRWWKQLDLATCRHGRVSCVTQPEVRPTRRAASAASVPREMR